MLKKYRLGFDPMGLMVFLLVMLPNFIWFACPAPNDVLRTESITPVWDTIASVCQVAMTGLLCILLHQERKPLRLSPPIIVAVFSLLLYYACWLLYYANFTQPPVILGLSLPPCLVFLLFALDRKNYPALIPGFLFTICHLVYAIVNFM